MTVIPHSLLDSDERLRRYAELAIRVGATVQADQEVVVTGYVEHAEIARAVRARLTAAGAKRVTVRYRDHSTRTRPATSRTARVSRWPSRVPTGSPPTS